MYFFRHLCIGMLAVSIQSVPLGIARPIAYQPVVHAANIIHAPQQTDATKPSLWSMALRTSLASLMFSAGMGTTFPVFAAETNPANYLSSIRSEQLDSETSSPYRNFVGKEGFPIFELTFLKEDHAIVCFNNHTRFRTKQKEETLYFQSKLNRPREGLRVRITNLTYPFLDEKYWPISDRAYDGNLTSEKIEVQIGEEHKKKRFVLFASADEVVENVLYFQVYEESTGDIIERGEVYLPVSLVELPPSVELGNNSACRRNGPRFRW